MNDYEKLKNLLTDFGVGFEEGGREAGGTVITCSVNDEKVVGYALFLTEFTFDESGNFIEMGVWE